MRQIETDIRKIIDEVTCTKYTGKLKVHVDILPDDSTLWMLLLYLDMEMTPMILAYEGTEDEFKEFIRKEIKSRKLENVTYSTLKLNTLEDEQWDYE